MRPISAFFAVVIALAGVSLSPASAIELTQAHKPAAIDGTFTVLSIESVR